MTKRIVMVLMLLAFVSGAMPVVARGEEPLKDRLSEGTSISTAVENAQQEVRDPFASSIPAEKPAAPVVAAPVVSNIKLQGIGVGSEDAYAVMNGDVFFEGEEKNGIKLVSVRKREVDIETGGLPQTLSMLSESELKKLQQRRTRKPVSEQREQDTASF